MKTIRKGYKNLGKVITKYHIYSNDDGVLTIDRPNENINHYRVCNRGTTLNLFEYIKWNEDCEIPRYKLTSSRNKLFFEEDLPDWFER